VIDILVTNAGIILFIRECWNKSFFLTKNCGAKPPQYFIKPPTLQKVYVQKEKKKRLYKGKDRNYNRVSIQDLKDSECLSLILCACSVTSCLNLLTQALKEGLTC
jgi:hypothetical protein